MFRWTLLKMSRSNKFKNLLMKVPTFKKSKERFVAGETLYEAVSAIKKLNSDNLATSVDYLGENVKKEEDSIAVVDKYVNLLEMIKEENLSSHVSVKLTALGLDVNEKTCKKNLEQIISKAAKVNSFVRIDMENSPYTDRTLRLYNAMFKQNSNVGIVLQSALYRTMNDACSLIDKGIANIRLCKGAYLESADIAYQKKSDVDINYCNVSQKLLDSIKQGGVHPAFATHDENMIDFVTSYAKKENVSRDDFEFQMLYGIRYNLQKQLVDEGYKVRVYVPFGKDWYGYFLRRLAERPANLWFVMKNMFK